MNETAVTLGTVISVCALIGLVLIAVVISKAHQRTLSTLDSMSARSDETLNKALDRLMTIKWEDFASMQTLDEGEEGGFFAPSEQKEEADDGVRVVEPGQWGTLEQLYRQSEAQENEARLLAEDFPDERRTA
jgi:hypothetical protein